MLKNWLAKLGRRKNGTALLIPSRVEFQPQWLTKQAIEGWLISSFCQGTQLTIFQLGCSLFGVLDIPGRTSQSNGVPLSSKPRASLWNWVSSWTAKLPNETHMTERAGWPLSQVRQEIKMGFHHNGSQMVP